MATQQKPHQVQRNTSFYYAWNNMKIRCNNPRYREYYLYGGRGIKVDSRWDSFEGFYDDMFNGYVRGLTLDRIDNNGNYSPENCRWATTEMQANNKRNNNYITFEGITKTLSQWARAVGVKGSTMRQRYYVYGWSVEKCLTTVPDRRIAS